MRDRRLTPAETIALLEATLEASQDGILVADLNRQVVYCNGQYLRMFDLTRELVARGVDAIVAAMLPQIENADYIVERSQAVWSEPELEVVDMVRFKDGRVFERFVVPHRLGGTIVGRVASFRDISRFARTEQALEQHRAFLEKAQEVGHIGSWVAELDGSDRLGWSVEAHRIFGVALGSFEGTSESFFARVHPADVEAVRAASAGALADQRLRHRAPDHPLRRRRSLGQRARRHRPRSGGAAAADDRHGPRHHGSTAARGSTSPVAEDGSDRPVGRGHRSRSQQRADRHRRLLGAGARLKFRLTISRAPTSKKFAAPRSVPGR